MGDQANDKTDEALATLDTLSDADWAQFYQRYHRALIADVAGRPTWRGRPSRRPLKRTRRLCGVADAYARHLVNTDNRKLARQTLKTHIAKSSEHPLSLALLADIDAGKTPPLLVTAPNDGLAEVFYGIGDALAGEGGLRHGHLFLQFALYLKPDFPLAQVALAEAYDHAKRYDLELAAFDDVKEDSPLWLNVQIQKAMALNALDRVDDAKALLEKIARKIRRTSVRSKLRSATSCAPMSAIRGS